MVFQKNMQWPMWLIWKCHVTDITTYDDIHIFQTWYNNTEVCSFNPFEPNIRQNYEYLEKSLIKKFQKPLVCSKRLYEMQTSRSVLMIAKCLGLIIFTTCTELFEVNLIHHGAYFTTSIRQIATYTSGFLDIMILNEQWSMSVNWVIKILFSTIQSPYWCKESK